MAADTWHIMIITIWIPCCYLGSGELALKSMWKTGIIAFLACCIWEWELLRIFHEINHWQFSPQLLLRWSKKKKNRKKKIKPQHGGRIPCNNLGAHAVSFYRNNLILSSFDLPNVTVCFHPCNHLEFKPLSPTVSIRRRILADSQGHLWACGTKTLKLSNASFAVQRNSHLWL